jgi:hypothetical protein
MISFPLLILGDSVSLRYIRYAYILSYVTAKCLTEYICKTIKGLLGAL